MKACRTCREQKPAKAFGRRKANTDGRQSVCRACKAKPPARTRDKDAEPWRPRHQKTGATYRERQVA